MRCWAAASRSRSCVVCASIEAIFVRVLCVSRV
jgi:hypothetical protein